MKAITTTAGLWLKRVTYYRLVGSKLTIVDQFFR